tara:strand:- start:922 stop:1458 length:537 start_codon:yes stop_codon:yes gene_type:complete
MNTFAKKISVFCAVASFFTLANYSISLQKEISRLEGIVQLEELRSKVNSEWANELLYSRMSDLNGLTSDSLVQQGRLEGITAFLRNEEDFSSTWHEGYEQGLSQNEYIADMRYEDGYHAAMQDVDPNHPDISQLRPVKEGAILIPTFDDKIGETLPSVEESIEEFNQKAENLFNQEDE